VIEFGLYNVSIRTATMTPPKRTSGKYRTPRPLLDARKAIHTLKDANRFQSALLDRLE
jgi:hypothetical protein